MAGLNHHNKEGIAMNITIKINTDNAAFGDDPEAEVARILRATALHFEQSGLEDRPLYDSNGNGIGSVAVRN